MRLSRPLSSTLLAWLVAIASCLTNAPVVHATMMITTGEYMVSKAFLNSQCAGAPEIIYLNPIDGFTLQDCYNQIDTACKYAQDQVYVKLSCTSNMRQLMRNAYPYMDVIQEQQYKDSTCSTLDGIYVSAAEPTDRTETECTAGSTFYLINTSPVSSPSPSPSPSPTPTPSASPSPSTITPKTSLPPIVITYTPTTNSLQDEAKARRTVRIIGIACSAVVSSLLGYLWRTYCSSSSSKNNKVSEEPKAQSAVVHPSG